jgi:hypothetical protein
MLRASGFFGYRFGLTSLRKCVCSAWRDLQECVVHFSILKRGINGVYHHVGKHHLHRYLSEFDFRYNSRKSSDGQRTLLAIKRIEGKRLQLRDSSAA